MSRLELLRLLEAAQREGTIVSSDREKLKCLKILAEVEQYILQEKRDPTSAPVAEVMFMLQSIIDESAGKDRIALKERQNR